MSDVFNPPIPVEVEWTDAFGSHGVVDLSEMDQKGRQFCFIAYLYHLTDDFATFVSQYATDVDEEFWDRTDIPLGMINTMTEMRTGNVLFSEEDYQ
jgi:hypothetical protein